MSEQQTIQPPLTWRPDLTEVENEETEMNANPLVGKCVDLDWAENDRFGGDGPSRYPIITVETEDGKRVRVHGFRTLLYNLLVHKLKPDFGEKIVLQFEGVVEPKGGGNSYYAYTGVMPEREGGSFNWGDAPATVASGPDIESARTYPDGSPMPYEDRPAPSDDDAPFE